MEREATDVHVCVFYVCVCVCVCVCTSPHQAIHSSLYLFLLLIHVQLPKTMPDEDVRAVFAPFGEIVEFIVLRDKMTGESKGM